MLRWQSAASTIPTCSAPTSIAARKASWAAHRRSRRTSSTHEAWDRAPAAYGMPTEIDVQADGPLRIITVTRPDPLTPVNDALHHALAKLWQRMSDDQGARAAVIPGAG